MKFCLVNPPDPVVEDTQWDEPLGLMYLGAVLEQSNIDVKIVDLNFHKDYTVLDKVDADWFGLYASSSMIQTAKHVARYIKRTHPHAQLMVGGPHATCYPADFTYDFDKVVSGEGEKAILKALTHDEQIVSCPPIEDLDTIPFPARHLLPIKDYHRRIGGEPSVGIITSRGCPHSCSFCSKVWGKTVRFRSADNVIKEVEYCINNYDIHAFNIRDDTYTLNRPRLYTMLEGFRKLDIKWRCLTRVNQVNEGLLRKMDDSGCVQIVYGLESGNQDILDKMNKGTTVRQNIEAIRMTRRAGIEAKAAVIVGSPGETLETVSDTIKMLDEAQPDSVILCIFTPYPGSAVWENPEAFDVEILTRDVSQYSVVGRGMRGNVVMRTKEMSKENIEFAHDSMLAVFRDRGWVK